MNFSIYLKFFLFAVLLVLLSTVGFNRLIDPYALYGDPTIEGVNANKPAFSSHAYMAKATAVTVAPPTTIFLGSSRGERGMDPHHPALRGDQRYNLSLSGSSIYEALRYFQHSHATESLKQVVLGLGLRQFKHADQVSPSFTEERLSVSAEGATQNRSWLLADLAVIASLDSIAASIETLWKQDETPHLLLHGEYNPQRLIEDMTSHRADFLSNEKSYINSHYKDFSFTDNKGGDSTLNQWEQWKRQLVALNESVAAEQGKSPFALWDFSGYNDYTTEVVPALGDTETQMQWYWESSHYKKELGDLVLDRTFSYKHPERKIVKGFGALLNSENIETHLQKLREDRQQWRVLHPEDVVEIEALKSS